MINRLNSLTQQGFELLLRTHIKAFKHHIILPISLRNVSLCRFKCLQRNKWRLHFDMRFFPQRNGVLSVQWNISSSNQKSFQINSFILDLNFFQSAPIENLFSSDTLESHKLGKLSMVDGVPFIISGYRTFETEKLEGREWKQMPIFPFRDFGENT